MAQSNILLVLTAQETYAEQDCTHCTLPNYVITTQGAEEHCRKHPGHVVTLRSITARVFTAPGAPGKAATED